MVTHFNFIRNYYSHNELLGLSIAELAHSHSVSLDQRSQALDTNQIKLHVTILQCKILTSKQFFFCCYSPGKFIEADTSKYSFIHTHKSLKICFISLRSLNTLCSIFNFKSLWM